MDRIAVHRIELHFLAIQEGRLGGDGPRRHDVAIGQNETMLGIDDESSRLRRRVPLRVECARRIHVDGDDTARDALERHRPIRVFFDRGSALDQLFGLMRLRAGRRGCRGGCGVHCGNGRRRGLRGRAPDGKRGGRHKQQRPRVTQSHK